MHQGTINIISTLCLKLFLTSYVPGNVVVKIYVAVEDHIPFVTRQQST